MVPVTLLIDGLCFGPHFSYCMAKATETLPKGSEVTLPLWLAAKMQEKNLLRVDMPKIFGAETRDLLEAGAATVDLRAMSPYYYTLGLHIVNLTKDDDLRKCLRATLAGERFEKIFDWSQNADLDTDIDDLLEKLTEEERELFYAGYFAQREAADFKARSARPKIRTADVFAKASKILTQQAAS